MKNETRARRSSQLTAPTATSMAKPIRCASIWLAMLSLSCSLSAQVPDPGSEGKIQLQWLKDYSEALKKAETEKKPLLIDITTDWCGWSKKMDRETFADTAVQKELRSFVLIRLNPEASDKNQKIADSYTVDGFPTLVVANYQGEQIGCDSGYKSPKELLDFVRRFLPLLKANPLGYKRVQLEPADPLMKAIRRIPPPDARPTTVGAFVVLDQSSALLQTNGNAKFLIRTSTFISDPEKGDLPEASLHYVSSRQKAKFKSIRILNLKGEGREMDLKLAKDEHAYSNQNIYWDVRSLSLELPALKEGQILDVVEELENQPIIPNQFCYRWNTGLKILLSSDLTITFPPSLNLQRRAVRCPTEIKETRNPDGTLTWELITSNQKPFEPVMFSPPLYEIWEGYDFYTPSTKDSIAQWYASLCQGRDVLPALAIQRIAALKRNAASQAALLQSILDWVTKDIRYVSVAFGASSHQPHAVSDTLGNAYGDCKDQSLLVKSLCREAGIKASLVLLDAFGEPVDEKNPGIERFNHCIVEAVANGKPYYLDPAAGPAKIGQVSPLYAGTKALKLDGATGSIVTLPPYQPVSEEESNQTLVKLNPNGSGTVTETTLLSGQRAAQMKERMKSSQPEKVRKYLEESYKKAGRKLLDFYMTDTNSTGESYETRIAYTIPRFGSMTAGGLVFNLGGEGRHEDRLAALNLPRSLPFWFRSTDSSKLTFTVEFPGGAVLKSRPDDIQIDTPFMKASRKLAFKDNKLTLTETSQLLDARLDASEASTVYGAFRKLQDHREYAFVVEMPSSAAAGAASAEAPTFKGIKLNGISGIPPRALAIINGKTLAAGESAAIKVDTRSVTIHCREITTDSAIIAIDGVDAPQELHLR